MKHLFILACTIALITSGADSQWRNRGGIAFSGGIAMKATSDDGNESELGYNAGVALDFPLGQSVSLLLAFDYNHVPFNGDQFVRETQLWRQGISKVSADPAEVMTAFANLKIFLSGDRSSTSSYINIGGGYFDFSMSNLKATDYYGRSATLKEFKFNALAALFGFGIDVPLGTGANFFSEVNICAAFTQTQTVPFVPAKCGLKAKL